MPWSWQSLAHRTFRNLSRILLSSSVLLIACRGAPDQSDTLLSDTPFLRNEKLQRTVNLGNALEAPQEGDWGVTLRAEYFRLIAGQGFTAVRIPIRWNAHADTGPPYTIAPDFFERVDWAVQQALSNGLAVIINIHHYEELMADPAAHKDRFLALWQQIAAHYRSAPAAVIFELLNEPNGQLTPALWNSYAAQAVAVVRESNPHRTLMIGPGNWNNVDALPELTLPAEEGNVIVTFHYYSPFHFTHQGASWAGEESQEWLGTTWEGTPQEQQAIQTDLEKAVIWGERHHRPVFLGEFGAYSAADMASRGRWTAYIARQAETHGISWGYWEFCAGFGLYDPQAGEWRTPLLRALIPPE